MPKRLALLLPLLLATALSASAATAGASSDQTPAGQAASVTGAHDDAQTGTAGGAAQKPAPPATQPKAQKAPAPKRPPQKGDWLDKGYLSVNVMYQGGSSSFTQDLTWQYFAETALATVQYPAKSVPGFDASGGIRLWRNLAVGVGVSAVSRSVSAEVTGSVPNPLYLNRPRTLTGSFSATNSETAVHVQAVWGIPMPPKMLLMVFGGPVIFSVKQTVVQPQGLQFPSVYPYEDLLTVTGASTTDASKTAIGFGAGADFSYFFTANIGAGGLVRYAGATASIPVGTSSVSLKVGGFQAAGGLRVRFGAPAKPRPPADPKPAPPKK
jgi:hypothetical protein